MPEIVTNDNVSIELIEKALNKVEEIWESNPNWKHVFVSYKEINGEPNKQLSITLGVDEKIEHVSAEDKFPDSFTIDDSIFVSDVVEMEMPEAERCNTLPSPGTNENTWVMPASGSRTTQRPLKGGLSVGSIPSNGWGGGYVNTGTLGGLAVDLDDYTIVGVSNNHVLGGRLTYGGIAGAYYDSSNEKTWWSFLSADEVSTGQTTSRYPVIQRSSFDQYSSTWAGNSSNLVGTVKGAIPFVDNAFGSPYNRVDVATFALDPSVPNLSSTSVNWQQYTMDYQTPMEWATKAEIFSLLSSELGAPIYKAGRTEGPVGWPGSAPYGESCKLSAFSLGSINVNMSGNLGSLPFSSQIAFRSNQGTNLPASSGGDSGSFVCALLSANNPALSAWKVIGLNFAGNSGNGNGYANYISNVAHEMRLSAYMGDEIGIGYKGYDMQVVEGRQTELSAMIGGKVYWQAGSTSSPATTSFDP